MTTLRFITDLSQETAFNMAADQYVLQKCVHEDTLYVRFYSWRSPSITLGYMQKATETLSLDLCKENAIQWIRRPTGGRAVLHYGDLTYSCIFPKTLLFMGSTVKESYAAITKCLLNGLRSAGVDCSTHDSYDQLLAVKREIKLPCFLAPNRDEIMVNGRKLVGSAQKRISDSILQHGSIPVTAGFCDLPQYLNIGRDEKSLQKSLLQTKSICLHEINPQLQIEPLIDFLKQGFVDALQIKPVSMNWTDEERKNIIALAESADFVERWMS